MSRLEQLAAKQMLDVALEYGDGSEASEDAIRFLHALSSGRREAVREVIREIIFFEEETPC